MAVGERTSRYPIPPTKVDTECSSCKLYGTPKRSHRTQGQQNTYFCYLRLVQSQVFLIRQTTTSCVECSSCKLYGKPKRSNRTQGQQNTYFCYLRLVQSQVFLIDRNRVVLGKSV